MDRSRLKRSSCLAFEAAETESGSGTGEGRSSALASEAEKAATC